MASSVSSANGFTVVTHVYPQQGVQSAATPQSGAVPPASSLLGKFLKGEPAALGTVQIMIGVVVILFGIVMAFYASAISTYSGIMFWGAIIYITAGSLTVRANKKLNPCLVKASLGMNIFSTITAGIAIIMHSLDFIFMNTYANCYNSYDSYECQMNRNVSLSRSYGIAGVMIVLSILEFIVSICVSAFACKATCSSHDQQVIYVSTQVPSSFPTAILSAPPQNSCETPLFPPSMLPPVHSNVHGLRSGKPEDLPPEYTVTQTVNHV